MILLSTSKWKVKQPRQYITWRGWRSFMYKWATVLQKCWNAPQCYKMCWNCRLAYFYRSWGVLSVSANRAAWWCSETKKRCRSRLSELPSVQLKLRTDRGWECFGCHFGWMPFSTSVHLWTSHCLIELWMCSVLARQQKYGKNLTCSLCTSNCFCERSQASGQKEQFKHAPPF